MHLYLLNPVLYILERVHIVNGVGEYNSHGPSIVGLGDSFEPLLASCIPYLQLNPRIAHIEYLSFKVDALVNKDVPMVVRWELRKLF
jgi:hypothetical protein